MIFSEYPYTNFHELNLDWILKRVKDLGIKVDNFTALNSIKWAGYWDPSKVYEPYTVVRTASHAYLSLKAVPANVLVTDGEYWAEIFDYSVINSIELQSTGDTTDRTAEIEAALNMYGRVILGVGKFYTTGITMPAQTIIMGAGASSIIVLDPLVSSGAAVKMGSRCQVTHVKLAGNISDITPDGTIGDRHGIEWTGSPMLSGCITDVYFENFTGAAIYAHDTTTSTNRGLMISGCMIRTCNVGIYFRKNTEYHKVVGCTITTNYYGILNRGGNNTIVGCGLDSNTIGVQEDEDEGSNGGRMTLSGCSINHAASASYSVYIKASGAIITGCHFNFGAIYIDDALKGVIIDGCLFGQQAPITIAAGLCNIIQSCRMHSAAQNPVTFDNSSAAKLDNCYYRDGSAVVPTVI